MMDDMILIIIACMITLAAIIVAAINAITYLKYYKLQVYPNPAGVELGKRISGIYIGVERRARKRASGPVYRRPDENLAFR